MKKPPRVGVPINPPFDDQRRPGRRRTEQAGEGWRQGLAYCITTAAISLTIPTAILNSDRLRSHSLTSTSADNPYSQLTPDQIEDRKELMAAYGVSFRARYSNGTTGDYAYAKGPTETIRQIRQHCVISVPEHDPSDLCAPSFPVDPSGTEMCPDLMWGQTRSPRPPLSDDAYALFVFYHEEAHCLQRDTGVAIDLPEPPARVFTGRLAESVTLDRLTWLEQQKLGLKMVRLEQEWSADLYAALRTLQVGSVSIVEHLADRRWIGGRGGDSEHMTGALVDELLTLYRDGGLEEQAQSRFGRPFTTLSGLETMELGVALRSEGLRYSTSDLILISNHTLVAMAYDGSLQLPSPNGDAPRFFDMPEVAKRIQDAMFRDHPGEKVDTSEPSLSW